MIFKSRSDTQEYAPCWLPDSQRIVLGRNSGSSVIGIYRMSVNGIGKMDPLHISTKGGDSPLWSRDGRRLYYREGDRVMAVTVETKPEFRPGKPEVLFQNKYYSSNVNGWISWDIDPEGSRFLMMKEMPADGTSRPGIDITLNWFEKLKERVPVP